VSVDEPGLRSRSPSTQCMPIEGPLGASCCWFPIMDKLPGSGILPSGVRHVDIGT
jgi:hypothetical protein